MNRRRYHCYQKFARRALFSAALFPLFLLSTARAETWRAERSFVAATSQHLYVVAASPPASDSLPEIRFWMVDIDAALNGALPSSNYQLEPILGEARFALADRDFLRLLFSDLSLFRYDAEIGSATDALYAQQSDLPPLKVAGDPSDGISWFLVESEGLLEQSATSRPTASAPAATERENATRLTLLRLKNGFWSRQRVPDALSENGSQFTLAANQGELTLLVAHKDSTIRFATLANDIWSSIDNIPGTLGLVGLCADRTVDGQLSIAVAQAFQDKSSNAPTSFQRIRIARRTDDGWQLTTPLRDGSELLEVRYGTSDSLIIRDRIAIARARDDGRIDFALTELKNDAVAQFNPLSNEQEQKLGDEATFGDFVRTLLALGILTVVWSSRRNDILRPAALPEGFMPAPIWKRGLGALIDLTIPFGAWFLLLKWQDPALFVEVVQEASGDPALVERFETWWILLVVLYGAHCLLWESLGHASMGKRILNCRILSIDGSAATGRQLFVRNLVRIVVLSLGMPGIVATMMMMMLFTRNNQRIGDLAANTLVVHPIPKWMEEMDLYPPDRDDD